MSLVENVSILLESKLTVGPIKMTKRQAEYADLAIDGMKDSDNVDRNYLPVMKGRTLSLYDHRENVMEFLYRVEELLPEMDEGGDDSKRHHQQRVGWGLGKKVRNAYKKATGVAHLGRA